MNDKHNDPVTVAAGLHVYVATRRIHGRWLTVVQIEKTAISDQTAVLYAGMMTIFLRACYVG
jgi:ABC-type phosphonate transport system ATPase subunit